MTSGRILGHATPPSISLSAGRVGRAAALLWLILVAACATPNYQKPVDDFADATRNAEQALTMLNDQVTESYATKLRSEIEAGERLVQRAPGDCLVTSERCRVAALDASGSREQFPPEPLLGNMVALMASIRLYAEGLQAIAHSKTADEVQVSMSATLGSITNLAGSVDRVAKTDLAGRVGAYQSSVGKLVNWFSGKYIAKLQVDALRQATTNAHPVIARASEIFDDTMRVAADVFNVRLVEDVEAAFECYENSSTGQSLDAVIVRAEVYDRVLRADPSSVYRRLSSAHEALMQHLQNEDPSLSEVMARIERFAEETHALVQAVNEIAQISNR